MERLLQVNSAGAEMVAELQRFLSRKSLALLYVAFWAWPVMIRRAIAWLTVSRYWPAKNIIATSMIANNSAKNSGATIANCTAAEPRLLRRNRRSSVPREAAEAAGEDIVRFRSSRTFELR